MVKFTRFTRLANLAFTLLLLCPVVQGQTEAAPQPPDIEEAERLRLILRQYYAEEDRRDFTVTTGDVEAEKTVQLDGENYSSQQVLLNGTQGIMALEHVSQRLASSAIADQRRPQAIIFHAEVRRDGTLLSSQSHSLKPLGKFQYATSISLPAGEVMLRLRDNSWTLVLSTAETTDYLITLSALHNQRPELHVIPVPELKATNWTDFPPWLPPIGALPNATPGS